MELIQSSFQASFNARIERLGEQETNELRTIFRYFDSDNDGAVSADQALRIFRLLGLDVNPVFVRDLGEVYLAEFLKIVDSNTPVAEDAVDTQSVAATAITGPAGTSTVTSRTVITQADEEIAKKKNAQLWEDEWRVMDSYRRGFVTREDLRSFLKSCFTVFPPEDLDRFLELYADPTMPEDSMTLTKSTYIKFRHEYTLREKMQAERAPSSDEEEDDEDEATVDQTSRPTETPDDAIASTTRRASSGSQLRRRQSNSISHVNESGGEPDEIVIDAGVIDDEFAEEDDTGTVNGDAHYEPEATDDTYEPLSLDDEDPTNATE